MSGPPVAMICLISACVGLIQAGVADADVLQPSELRNLHANLPPIAVYPAAARAQHLEGRVLVEFHLDRLGNTVGARIVEAQADEILQTRALELFRNTRYDLGLFSVDPKMTFRVSFIYCMDHCQSFAEYPNSNSLLKFTAIPYPGH